MYNRRAILELYTVPDNASGRKECSGVITADNRLIRQNLMLTLVDITKKESERLQCGGHCGRPLYQTDFYDSQNLFERLEEMSKRFNGTHSRRSNLYYDDASFRILDRDKLIEYIQQIKSEAVSEPTLSK